MGVYAPAHRPRAVFKLIEGAASPVVPVVGHLPRHTRIRDKKSVLRGLLPKGIVTELTESYVSPDPQQWIWNQYKYYVQPGYLRMRPDEVAQLRLYLSSTYMPDEPCGILTHAEYFEDLDLTRSAGWPSLHTKAWFWNYDYNRAINGWERFVATGEIPDVIGVVSPKLNETLAPTKVTRLVVCLPADFHHKEKRVLEPILSFHRQNPWRGAMRVGTSMRGEAHRIFNDFADDDEVYECDLTGQEFCHNDDVTGLLSWLCQRQSSRPDLVRALFDANRKAKLLFPDGTLTDATPAEKSGSMYTLTGNSICTEMQWVRAHYNIALAEGFPYDPAHLKLHILGDNSLAALRGPLRGKMLAFQMLFRTYGFHLKVQRSAGRGAWGLVWCGFTKEGPREWLKFTKPLKMLAKAYYDAPDAECCKQQLLAVYTLCWNTPLRDVAAQALERLKRQCGTPYVLPSYFDVQCTLAEGIEQGRGGFSFSTSAVVPLRASNSVHNGQRGPPNKRVAMPKGYGKKGGKIGPPTKRAHNKGIRRAKKQVKRKERPRRKGNAHGRARASVTSAPAAEAWSYRPIFSRKSIPGGCLVTISDYVMPVMQGAIETVASLPFSLDIKEQSLQQPGSVNAKLRQEASLWCRYQVESASVTYVGKVGTDVLGDSTVAIIPGELKPPTSARELSSFMGASIGPVWDKHRTGQWKPRENRLFLTDRGGPDGGSQRYPFSVAAACDGIQGTSTIQHEVGNVFLTVKIRFVDSCEPPSNTLVLAMSEARVTEATHNFQMEWNGMNAQVGDFNWNPRGVGSGYFTATPAAAGSSAAGTLFDNVPNRIYFDLEAGTYYMAVYVDLTAAPEEKVNAGFEVVRHGKPTVDGPEAKGDVFASLIGTRLTEDQTQLWTIATDSATVATAYANAFWFFAIIPSPMRCYVNFNAVDVRTINSARLVAVRTA